MFYCLIVLSTLALPSALFRAGPVYNPISSELESAQKLACCVQTSV